MLYTISFPKIHQAQRCDKGWRGRTPPTTSINMYSKYL